jgi:hypothetical protein
LKHSTGTWIYGYNNDHQTAEAIVERKDGHPLANFGSTTFYGVGITDNNQYRPMGTTSLNPVPGVPHDFSHMYQCVSSPGANCKALNTSVQLAEVKPIVGDPGDNPYDQYAVVYHNPW